jgi:hypothetical protein
MREAQEGEGLRLAVPTRRTVAGGEPPEPDEARLVGVQLQGELRETLAEVAEEPLCVIFVLEPGDEVVGLCRGPDYAEV